MIEEDKKEWGLIKYPSELVAAPVEETITTVWHPNSLLVLPLCG